MLKSWLTVKEASKESSISDMTVRRWIKKHKQDIDYVKYEKGICPVAELLYEKELVNTMICRPPATIEDMQDVVSAIHKIIENKNELS